MGLTSGSLLSHGMSRTQASSQWPPFPAAGQLSQLPMKSEVNSYSPGSAYLGLSPLPPPPPFPPFFSRPLFPLLFPPPSLPSSFLLFFPPHIPIPSPPLPYLMPLLD